MSSKVLDSRFMNLAISLANRNLGKVWPNPSVGCVIVNNGTIVGRGITGEKGCPHAEVLALHQAKEKSVGSTVYVTLEPCCHTGKTPPCTTSLIESKISRIVCPMKDPDPRVSGKGLVILKDSGIEVTEFLEHAKPVQDLVEGFATRIKVGRPMITLKLATSIDGKIATKNSESKWITSEKTRGCVQLLRSKSDAILIGKRTAIIDNPRLNLRDQFSSLTQPLKLVLDRDLSIPHRSNLSDGIENQTLILIHGKGVSKSKISKWNKQGVGTMEVGTNGNNLNLSDLMLKLGNLGLTRLLVEGGGKLATSLLNAKLIDKIVIYTGGVIIGNDGIPAWGTLDKNYSSLAKHPQLKLESSRYLGNDCEHIWRLLY